MRLRRAVPPASGTGQDDGQFIDNALRHGKISFGRRNSNYLKRGFGAIYDMNRL
jgi:hypothetical protein